MNNKRDWSCTSPMAMERVGVNPSGKPKYRMRGLANELDYRDPNMIIVPCGNCINCRLKKSREWADRIMIESWDHEQSWFVTLTYNDFWVPESKYIDSNTGELIPVYSLWKRDFQLFIKRLRKNTGQQLRYYLCGEYGDLNQRPHGHAIIFGLKLDEDDLYNERRGKSGFSLWQSKTIEKAWSKRLFNREWPIGHIMVAPMNWQTAAYVSRYVTKKLKGPLAQVYKDLNIEPPFSLKSTGRNPYHKGDPNYKHMPCGIGRNLYRDNSELVRDKRKMYVPTGDGSKLIMMPKYYDPFLELDFPDDFAIIKEDRSSIGRTSLYQQPDTDLDFFEYNRVREADAESRLKKLIRNEV